MRGARFEMGGLHEVGALGNQLERDAAGKVLHSIEFDLELVIACGRQVACINHSARRSSGRPVVSACACTLIEVSVCVCGLLLHNSFVYLLPPITT